MKKTVIITLILLVILVIIWKREWLKEKLGIFKTKSSETDQSNSDEGADTEASNPQSDDKPPLKKGSRGENVLKVQKALNLIHKAGLLEDGVFGTKTEQSLEKYGYGKTVETADILKLSYQLKNRQ